MTHTQHTGTILALETSCDETSAAVVREGRTILSQVIASQMEMHQRYGGIVPEVASRQHILSIVPVIHQALAPIDGGWDAITAIAATYGPGLSGALLTGLNIAKAMAWQRGVPFIGVNHIEAHIYANWLITADETPPPQFPLVALVVSGGHTLLALMTAHSSYTLLGQTRDDAVGEAFDKVARMLGLGYPGGPAIERIASSSDSNSEKLPRAWLRNSYDFSFSGLKTAVLHRVQHHVNHHSDTATTTHSKHTPSDKMARTAIAQSPQFVAHTAHAFQESVVDVLVAKTVRAATEYHAKEIVLAGGVAANQYLRNELQRRADIPVRYPSLLFCTDNAAMVGAAAYYRFHNGQQHTLSPWDLDVAPSLHLV